MLNPSFLRHNKLSTSWIKLRSRSLIFYHDMPTFAKGFYPLVGKEGCFIFVLLTLSMTADRLAALRMDARTQAEIEELLSKQNKPAIKTIQSAAGETIDCVDIYKQPSLDHPLLKNHTIEMRPSFIPEIKLGANSSSYAMAEQTWLKNGSCPEGTIPTLRITKDYLLRAGSSVSYGLNGGEPVNCRVEVAGARAGAEAPYYGVTADINIWNSLVMVNEWSLNSIAAVNQESLIESGWGVSVALFGDSKPRLYANWRDGNKGCYNLVCPGFIQVSRKVVLGSTIDPISVYNGDQYQMHPTIYKDDIQRKWWLMYRTEVVGYWPMALFSNLESASNIEWLGRVCNTEDRGYHTTTQMGSGHWPSEGWSRSAYIEAMLVVFGSSTVFSVPNSWEMTASYSGCYDVKKYETTDELPSVFYGGPGGPCCDGRCQ